MTTATNWRDLADQLTAEQVALMEYCEANEIPPGLATQQGHLNAALTMIAENEAQAVCAHIPTPADAIDIPSLWMPWDEGGHGRTYTYWARQSGGFEVAISAWQFSDGRSTERDIAFEDTDDEQDMTADRARELAALLLDAADQLDHLNAEDQQ